MTNSVKLSVIVATHNEEANIRACLQSIHELADEIIIADGESTDKTVAIALEFDATVLHMSNKRMFHFNKEEARKKAKGEWILFLDADEIIPKLLSDEIRSVLDGTHDPSQIPADQQQLFQAHQHNIELRDSLTFSKQPPIVAYFIARKNFFLGRYLMHSGVYPDGVIRLVKAGAAHWPCKDVHETMAVDGGVAWLKEPMIHMADPTFSRYLQRANRYTTLTADQLKEKHIGTQLPTVVRYVLWLPLKTFLLLFIRHKGFLDGFSGFVWAVMSGLHFPIAYFKYIEALR